VSERLLVIDDDHDIRRAYEAHFGGAGFEVHSAADLKEAIELLATNAFDAVIADVGLTPEEGSGGLAIAAHVHHLRRTSPAHAAPILALTAYGSPERAGAAARLGVDVFLHKPVSLLWLEKELRARIGERWTKGRSPIPAEQPLE
jgi:two-component system response regulator PilR (NtrC family)